MRFLEQSYVAGRTTFLYTEPPPSIVLSSWQRRRWQRRRQPVTTMCCAADIVAENMEDVAAASVASLDDQQSESSAQSGSRTSGSPGPAGSGTGVFIPVSIVPYCYGLACSCFLLGLLPQPVCLQSAPQLHDTSGCVPAQALPAAAAFSGATVV